MAITTTTKTGGDDLDDYLELDPSLVASGSDVGSEDEEDVDDAVLDVEGEGDRPVLYEEDGGGTGMNEGVKRKAGSDDDEERRGGKSEEEERKRRKKEKTKERKARRLAAQAPSGPDTPPTHLSPESLLDLLRTSLLSTHPSLTPMEITDRLIPLPSLLPAPEHAPPTDLPSGSFEPLRRRVGGLLKKGGKIQKGRPRIIILCLNALRCIEVMNNVKDLKGEAQVAKLFAKHIKAPEQRKFLEATPVSIAVGTPARIGTFLGDGTISVDKNTILLLDIGHQDSKTRTLLTMPDTRVELWKSVFAGPGRKALLDGGGRIGAF